MDSMALCVEVRASGRGRDEKRMRMEVRKDEDEMMVQNDGWLVGRPPK